MAIDIRFNTERRIILLWPHRDDPLLGPAQFEFSDSVFDAAWNEGAALTLDQALVNAVTALDRELTQGDL